MPTNTVQAVSPYYNPTIEEVSTVPNIKSAKKRVKVARLLQRVFCTRIRLPERSPLSIRS